MAHVVDVETLLVALEEICSQSNRYIWRSSPIAMISLLNHLVCLGLYTFTIGQTP